jgi:DNA-binding winged helix-turn-helix (wHTH) protein
MPEAIQGPAIRRFGAFELSLQSGELRKSGIRLRLTGQPFQVLAVLVQRAGEVVTREELHSKLWPADTFVDFDHGLNNAVARIRDVLNDSSDTPRYIETIPRRGYRFIAPMRAEAAASELEYLRKELRTSWRQNRRLQVGAGISITILAAAIVLWGVRRSAREDVRATVYRFTSYPGLETMPAFSPDGKEIAYVRAEHDPIAVHLWGRQMGQAHIYIKLVGAGTELQLTKHSGADYYPAWSRD